MEQPDFSTLTPVNSQPDFSTLKPVLANSNTPNTIAPETKQPTFLGNVIRGIIKPFARVGTNLVQAGELATGNKVTEPFSGNYLGQVSSVGTANGGGISGQNLKDTLGTGLELGSYLVGGEGTGAVAETGIKGLLKEAAIQGAKTGATVGAMQGAGTSLQNNEGIGNTLLNTTLGSLFGGATGAVLGGTTGLVGKGIGLLKTPLPEDLANKEIGKIQETIMPKPTVKEARLAESQGRLVKGEAPTLFKGQTPDTIIPSPKTISAAKTIFENIPNASKMDEPTLYSAIDSKVSNIAQNLTPEMEKTNIAPATIEKINNDWEALKKIQNDNPYLSNNVNLQKLQNDFEQRLQKSGNENMGHLWETRKIYDASVPDNVKRATDISSSDLQNQKMIWLQNRAILNDAINDSANGLGDISKKAFLDMSNLYSAKQSLLSKAKVSNKLLPSKIGQFANSTTGKVLKGVAGGAGALELGKKVLTGSF